MCSKASARIFGPFPRGADRAERLLFPPHGGPAPLLGDVIFNHRLISLLRRRSVKGWLMARTVIDLDEEIVEQAMRVYGVKTKAAAVRAAMEEGVKLRLRRELFDAMDDGEFEDVFAEIRSQTGPRNPDGSLKRDGGVSAV